LKKGDLGGFDYLRGEGIYGKRYRVFKNLNKGERRITHGGQDDF
jgi:hypothetical protein